MNLSFALLALQAVFLFSQTNAEAMLVGPFLLILSSVIFGLLVTLRYKAPKLTTLLGKIAAAGIAIVIAYFVVGSLTPAWAADAADLLTVVALPILAALLATFLLMNRPGLRAFWRALGVSGAMFIAFLFVSWYWHPHETLPEILVDGWRPWSLNSPWSSVLAWAVIGFYLAINAAFLQPYLGDAARYFRNSPANVAVRRAIRTEAVNLLERLHTSGQYDRIVVVAHSLGTVVAYDMLRAYFSRVCDQLPPVGELGMEFSDIDAGKWQPEDQAASIEDKKMLRAKARAVIANIAVATAKPAGQEQKPKSWLVTDFVTLGSALTHAYFLMCLGKTEADLREDFSRRVEEREFPTCPPKQLDHDGLLSFTNPKTGKKQVHNGALFGLTRWSNIYFPRRQLFWGDAIGGALSPIFGSHIVDLEVSTKKAGGDDFFTHTAYWDVARQPDTYQAPHIVTLRKAVDLADTGTAIDLVDEAADPNQHQAD